MKSRTIALLIVLLAVGSGNLLAQTPIRFDRDVRPILSDKCFSCHGPDESSREAELRLDRRDGAFADLGGHYVIVSGKPDSSELIVRIESSDPDAVMPPHDSKLKLSQREKKVLRQWIEQGAEWKEHWSLVRPLRPSSPKVKDAKWVRNPIDAFVLSRLESAQLTPSEEASRRTLIRRVSLDLTGIPPTLREVDAFLADTSDKAYERVVDRLVQSPRYGERMAWPWLEAARYADSNGYQGDQDRTMYPWRDWVVDAFNKNMRWDEFTVWQLAGDLLPDATDEQRLATGFCRNHMINGEGGRIAEENRIEYIFDQVETLSTVWLGLTMTCARCHDHKFDPVKQSEYYGLFAFFNQTPVNGGGGNPQTAPVLAVSSSEQKAQIASLENDIANLSDQAKLRDEKQKQLEAVRKSLPRVMVMQDQDKKRQTFILSKGLYNQPQDEVPAAVPASLPKVPENAPMNRLTLARWLVSPEHPLTSRVTVNRFWAQFFGSGLVKTPEDFGSQGEPPSHPLLLDYLAVEFQESGWDVKQLVRLIVTSATYRQSSRTTAEQREQDPTNRLLSRGARFRLPSWMLRDQALFVSGLLVDEQGGRPVKPYQPPGIWKDVSFGRKTYNQDHGTALYRRSLYTFWRRIIGPTMFFDVASRQTCEVKKVLTNTPLHALVTLNDTTYVEAGHAIAERLHAAKLSDSQRIELAFRLLLSRPPADEELKVLGVSINRLRKQLSQTPDDVAAYLAIGESERDASLDPVEHAAWSTLCLGLLNLDEALTKE